ncbi:hypothetical protein AO203_00120 [Lactobacillus gallinarum]|nr:hypothetical protein AO203_00120 [Lactobacillus gallinarum]
MTIRDLYKINPFRFIFVILLCILNASVVIISSYALTWQFNAIKSKNLNTFLYMILIQTFMLIAAYFFGCYPRYIWSKQIEELNHKIRQELTNHYFEKSSSTVSMQNQMINDLYLIKENYANSLLQIFYNLTVAIGVLFSLLSFHWSLCILSAVIAFLQILVPKLLETKLEEAGQNISNANQQYLKELGYWLVGISEIRRFLAGAKLFDILSTASFQPEKAIKKNQVVDSSLDFFNKVVYSLGDMLILILTGYLVIKKITQFGLISSISNFNWFLFGSLMAVSNFIGRIKSVIKVNQQVLQARENVTNKFNDNTGQIPVGLLIKDVSITFKNNKKIKFPNFKVKKGEKILLTGKSGIGKSTLFKIILGELQPDSGKVVYFGQTGEEIYPDLSKIGYLPQDPILFPTSIMNNITMFDSKINNNVQEAIKKVQLQDDLKELSEGLNTKIDLDKINISGGQRQKIILARAEIHNSRILLIDEGTSAIDKDNSSKIISQILKTDKTIVFIAHNLDKSTKAKFDRVISWKTN